MGHGSALLAQFQPRHVDQLRQRADDMIHRAARRGLFDKAAVGRELVAPCGARRLVEVFDEAGVSRRGLRRLDFTTSEAHFRRTYLWRR